MTSQVNIVVSHLIGGLGNQMFQYAVGRALALRTGARLSLDVTGFANYDLRRYELEEVTIDAEVAPDKQLRLVGAVAEANILSNRILKRLGFGGSQHVLREGSFTYDQRIEEVSTPIYLDGYWQSEKYFTAIASELRQDFSLRQPLDGANAEMAAAIGQLGQSAISLHIRRGDYVSNSHTAQYHGVCSLDYYRDAVRYLAERVEHPHFYIFSDDHTWVQENLQIDFPMTLVQINSGDRGIYDMMLMKSCGHHIIANSSFSWWGAWLNPSSQKIVIAPQQWFKQSTNDTRDLIPAAWVRL